MNSNFLKKNIRIICVIILIVILLIVSIVYFLLKKDSYVDGVIYLDEFKYSIDFDNHVFTNEVEFKKYFNDIDSISFDENNYVLISVSYDPCSESNLKVKDYNINSNKLNVLITYDSDCGGCAPQKKYMLLPVDKSITNITPVIDYKANNKTNCDPAIAYKPIIYLYPKEDMYVNISLSNPEKLMTSYPRYNDGWLVYAYTDGRLISNNREYYGLYWEANNHFNKIENDGFVVRGEDTLSFLEEKLKLLGLNDREANEFIIYWLPKLENNTYNYIRFETIDEINSYMGLDINPVPDSLIRIMMDYKPLSSKIDVLEQEIVTPTREGFTVVEWGGSLIK